MINELPPFQTGKSVWYGPSMNLKKKEWIIELTKKEIEELEQATKQFLNIGLSVGEMKKEHFPLPIFGVKLAELKAELIHGIGFSLIKGLPIKRYSEKETATIFYGIGTHIGNARSQNAKGHVLGQVRNMGVDSTDPKVRLYQTSERQTFHTDSCDVVGLLCRQPAKSGGLSLLVSANTIFNEMRERRPDLLNLLLQPIATDRRGEVPEGMLPYLLIPVFSYFQQKITPFYQRQYIDSAQRFPDAPRLTPQHFEALDLFDELCNDPKLHLSMMLEKGDMQFVYNHAMLHDRTAFVDYEVLSKRRHLARLWLSVEGDRPLPAVFATRYGSIEIGNRGGIMVKGTKLTIPWLSD